MTGVLGEHFFHMIKENKYKNIKYCIGFPDNFDQNRKYPAIVFFHGVGSIGDDMTILQSNTISEYYRNSNPNFILVEPLCYANMWFDIYEQVLDFLSFIRDGKYIDVDAVSITGNSLGGYLCWMLAMSKPEWFSAVAPVCGGGMVWNAEKLVGQNIHAFHGINDPIVPVEESINMVKAINQLGGNAYITIYNDCMHDSWIPTYSNPDFYTWIVSCKRHSKNNYKMDSLKGALYG